MAMTHREALEKEGIADLINLTKDVNKPVNIVKVIMTNVESANELLDKGRINLLHLFFQVVQDKPKQKVKNTTEVISRFNLAPTGYNSFNSEANLNLNSNTNNNYSNNMSINDLANNMTRLFSELNAKLDINLEMKSEQIRLDLRDEIKKSVITNKTNTNKIVKENNGNLATAMTEIFTLVSSKGSISNHQTLEIVNRCCPIINEPDLSDSEIEEDEDDS